MDVTVETPRSSEMLDGTNYIYTQTYNLNSKKLPVVCVHGIGSAYDTWGGLTKVLTAAGYSVLAYDLMGRGDSAYPENNIFDAAAHVEQLRKLIVSLHIHDNNSSNSYDTSCLSGDTDTCSDNTISNRRCVKQYHMIGHSMGGAVVTAYCAQYGAEVKSTVLLAPAGLMSTAGPLWLVKNGWSGLHPLIRSILTAGKEVAWRLDFADPRGERADMQVARLNALFSRVPTHFEAMWQSMLQFPLTGLDKEAKSLADSNISVFLLWGHKDKAVPFDNFSRWLKILDPANIHTDPAGTARIDTSAGSKILQWKTFKNLSHALFLDTPDEFHTMIRDFLDKCI